MRKFGTTKSRVGLISDFHWDVGRSYLELRDARIGTIERSAILLKAMRVSQVPGTCAQEEQEEQEPSCINAAADSDLALSLLPSQVFLNS